MTCLTPHLANALYGDVRKKVGLLSLFVAPRALLRRSAKSLLKFVRTLKTDMGFMLRRRPEDERMSSRV